MYGKIEKGTEIVGKDLSFNFNRTALLVYYVQRSTHWGPGVKLSLRLALKLKRIGCHLLSSSLIHTPTHKTLLPDSKREGFKIGPGGQGEACLGFIPTGIKHPKPSSFFLLLFYGPERTSAVLL